MARLLEVPAAAANPGNYATAQQSYLKLIGEMDKLRASLKKAKVYDDLNDLASKLELNYDSCVNVDAVAPKLLEQWKGLPERTQQFVALMEKAKLQRVLEVKLARGVHSAHARAGFSGHCSSIPRGKMA